MMKNITHIYILMSFFIIQSCESKGQWNQKNYYILIDSAENKIFDADYESALNNYKECYKINSNMFGVDIYNALLCSVYLKKWKDSEFWCNKLIIKGAEKKFFQTKVFTEFRKTNEWTSILKKMKQNKIVFNNQLKNQLDSLIIEDQKVYCGIPQGKLDYPKAKNNTITIEDKFIFLINEHGFPTEETFGLNIINDTLIAPIPAFGTLLRHGYQSNNLKIIEIYNEALELGKLDERAKNGLLDDDFTFVAYKDSLYKLKSQFMEENISLERRLKYMNKNRSKGFLIFAKFSTTGSFANESSIDAFHKMYDLFIPNWHVPQ